MNNNKYLTKLAALFYPNLDKTEFDMAFEGDGNPTRERIKNVARIKDREQYLDNMEWWKNEASGINEEPTLTRNYKYTYADHMAEMPLERDFDTLGNLRHEHDSLAARSGSIVPGPSVPGLGLGYGLGGAGLLAGAVLKNPALAIGGGLAMAATGLYHHQAQPEKRYNRFLDAALVLNEKKQRLLDLAAEDGI